MKFSWLFVISLGIFFSAIALGWGYREWDPNMKEVRSWKEYRDQLITEAGKAPQAIKRVKDAEILAAKAVNDWRVIAATRTLPPTLEQGGIDLGQNGWQMLTQLPLFRNSMQKMVNNQLKVGGVKVISGPTLPLTPTDPNTILSQYFNYPVLPPVVIFDLGTVTVQGTYKQITDNMRAWSRMPHFLAVADGLTLRGTSPRLTGTYQVSIVGFVQTTKPIFPEVPEGGRVISQAVPAGGAGAAAAATGLPGTTPNVPTAPAGRGANVPTAPAGGAARGPSLPPANAGRGANTPAAPAGAGRGAAVRPPGNPAAGRGAAGQPAGARPNAGATAPAGARPGATTTAGAGRTGAGGR